MEIEARRRYLQCHEIQTVFLPPKHCRCFFHHPNSPNNEKFQSKVNHLELSGQIEKFFTVNLLMFLVISYYLITCFLFIYATRTAARM